MRGRPALPRRAEALLVAVAALALYAVTLVPGPASGDSGEFQYMPHVLGLPHPPGFPLYQLLGWLWSWLPLGDLAWRMNLLSALFAAGTTGLLFTIARQQGLGRVAAASGALLFALSPGVWRYAIVAEVYSLNTMLLALALLLWFRWSTGAEGRSDPATDPASDPATGEPRHAAAEESASEKGWGGKRGHRLWRAREQGWAGEGNRLFLSASLLTGLGLTNHPTFIFLIPALLLFLLAHLPRLRRSWRASLVGATLFALPGVLYAYVPLRLVQIDPGVRRFGLIEPLARGVMSPFIRREWGWDGVVHYILDRSYTSDLAPQWGQLVSALPGVLQVELGIPFTLLSGLGALLWLRRRPRTFLPLLTLFLLSATFGLTVLARIAELGEVLDPAATLLPAVLVLALWVAQGVDLFTTRPAWLANRVGWWAARGLVVLALGALLVRLGAVGYAEQAAARQQSASIATYWSEVLAYPLEEGAALTGHWGDLTPFWYFQHGEGVRPDLWGIFPPNLAEIEGWLGGSGRPLYLAGPLLGWEPALAQQYELTPWGILVRIAPSGSTAARPPLTPRPVSIGPLDLQGYRSTGSAPGRRQLWLGWETRDATPRDLSVSLRLHAPDDSVLLQQDGRLASLWYPDATLPPGRFFLTVFEYTPPDNVPPGSTLRLVVYDPTTGDVLLTPQGEQVVELGRVRE